MTSTALDYPHPVLDGIGYDFPGYSFTAEVDGENSHDDSDGNLVLKMRTTLDCPGMQKMIEEGRAKPIVRIRCPRTSLREVRPAVASGEFELALESGRLEERVTLETMIVATAKGAEDPYALSEFNQEYFSGVSFTIRKGDMLAVAPDVEVKLRRSEAAPKDTPGIVQIARAMHDEELRVHYATQADAGTEREDYIRIYLPEQGFSSYRKLREKRHYNQADSRFLQSALVLPAITEAVGLLRDEEQYEKEPDDPTYQGTVWADSVLEALRRHDVEDLGSETASSYELANKILEDVAGDALDKLLQTLEECMDAAYGDDDL